MKPETNSGKGHDMFRQFVQDEEGAAAVEYGVLVALIIAALSAVIAILGGQVRQGLENFNNEPGNQGVNATPQ